MKSWQTDMSNVYYTNWTCSCKWHKLWILYWLWKLSNIQSILWLPTTCHFLKYAGSNSSTEYTQEIHQKVGRTRSMPREQELFVILVCLRCGLKGLDWAFRYFRSTSFSRMGYFVRGPIWQAKGNSNLDITRVHTKTHARGFQKYLPKYNGKNWLHWGIYWKANLISKPVSYILGIQNHNTAKGL